MFQRTCILLYVVTVNHLSVSGSGGRHVSLTFNSMIDQDVCDPLIPAHLRVTAPDTRPETREGVVFISLALD